MILNIIQRRNSITARGGGAVPIRDGTRRPSQGDTQEVHL